MDAQHYTVQTDIALGLRFPEGYPAEGWGRVLKLRHDSIEIETHFNLRENQRLFITFEVEGFYKFEEVPAKVAGIRDKTTLRQASCAIEPGPAAERLREALVFLVNRS